MDIIKRSGKSEPYNSTKITNAIAKAFHSTGIEAEAETLRHLLEKIEKHMQTTGAHTVEEIQDIVERVLMEAGFYPQAKNYILYRQRHAELRAARQAILSSVPDPALDSCLAKIQADFPEESYSLSALSGKYMSFLKPNLSCEEKLSALVKAAVELTTQEAPQWERIAARLLMHRFLYILAPELDVYKRQSYGRSNSSSPVFGA